MINFLYQKKPKIIFIMGPTASGKTLLVHELFKQLPINVISVDSVLIYKYMNIGTAKPTVQERKLIPYRLVDIKDPKDSYSVVEFLRDALLEIKHSIVLNKIPVLVGGTMFYFKTLLHGITLLPSADLCIREKIKIFANTFGWHSIYDYLMSIDPILVSKIHHNDTQRIMRMLEIVIISKKTLTELSKLTQYSLPYNVIQFAILPRNRNILNHKIILRYKKMLDSGFEYEVKNLYNRGDLSENLQSMRSVGYRQMWLYLSGKLNYNEMIYRSICATRQLAKRQVTWLSKWKNLHILDIDNIKNNVNEILKHIDCN